MLLRAIMGCCILWTKLSFASCIGLLCSCTTSATGLAFGSYNPISGALLNNMSTVSVTCSALVAGLDVSYVIALNTGANSAVFTSRRMRNGVTTNYLNYNLYTTTARTTIWGDGTAGTATISDAYLLNIISATRNYTVYGQVPASQNAIPGSYTDTVTVTVTY